MAQPDEVDHGWMHGRVFKLACDLKGWDIGDGERTPDLRKGQLVKVVMVSQLGDCGITRNLEARNGYEVRVEPEMLEEAKEHRF
jgi:hypothetical protein